MVHLVAIIKWKLFAALFAIGMGLLAVGEATADRTLIIISAITSGTSLLGVIISGAISLHNSRKLVPLAELPEKVEEFRREVDGRMTELRESRLQTSEAKQEVARAEGAAQERTEERDRVMATPALKTPVDVNVKNTPADPAVVKTVKDNKKEGN